MRYIATKHDLIGGTEVEKAHVLEMQDVAMTFRNAMVKFFYGDDSEEKKNEYTNTIAPKHLQSFENVLHERNTAFFGGESLSFVDFMMFELLDQVCIYILLKLQ